MWAPSPDGPQTWLEAIFLDWPFIETAPSPAVLLSRRPGGASADKREILTTPSPKSVILSLDLSSEPVATTPFDRLVGLVVKASASRAEGPGFEFRLRRDFFGVESYQ